MNNVSIQLIDNLIEELYPKYVDFWIKLCNVESHTPYKQGVDQVGKEIIEFTKDLGLKVEVLELDKSGNPLFLTLKSNGTKPPVCMTAHMDTVFPVGTIKQHPTRVDGDVLHALGAADCKGGVISCLMSLEVLSRIGNLDKDVTLLFNSEEEGNGSLSNKKSINAICEKAKDAICCLNFEMSRPHIPNGLCLERKGSYTIKIKVKGVSAHAGLCFAAGSNAILEASKKIVEIEKYKEEDGVTMNCGTIKGGVSAGVVPDSCEFEVNLRFFSEEQKQKGLNIISDLVSTSFVEGTTSCFEIVSTREMMSNSPKNYDLLDKLNEIYAKNGMATLTSYKTWGGSDSGELTCAGVPTVDCMGVIGYDIHNVNERAILSSLKTAVKRAVVATINL